MSCAAISSALNHLCAFTMRFDMRTTCLDVHMLPLCEVCGAYLVRGKSTQLEWTSFRCSNCSLDSSAFEAPATRPGGLEALGERAAGRPPEPRAVSR
jgi:hypothetical protein